MGFFFLLSSVVSCFDGLDSSRFVVVDDEGSVGVVGGLFLFGSGSSGQFSRDKL